ncbi:MAG: pectate lyase [Opitutaceae bacterium]
MRSKCLPPVFYFLYLLVFRAWLPAAVIGTNPESLPITIERISTLPAAEQSVWRDYLTRSDSLRAADEKIYADERKAQLLTESLVPTRGRSLPLKNPKIWYATAEARRAADITVSFQTPAGGWNKNTSFTDHLRRPGERSGYEHGYVGTIDNDATITPLSFLAKVITASEARTTESYRAAFARGLNYLITAQFPNGGWPQVYPLEGGYHDAITFNDDAMVNVITLLREISLGQNEFTFVSANDRARAAAATTRGLNCILATQIITQGRRTVWCQQYDPLTLAPSSARNYEMPAQSSGESAKVVLFLMELPNPSSAVVAAVHASAAWFEKTALRGVIFKPAPDGSGRKLQSSPGAASIWPRYAEIGSDRPVFGDRDKSIHDNVNEISQERRNGYAWFGDGPRRVLDHYRQWAQAHPLAR